MHALYVVSWLHLLAATVWIGGMFFLVLVVVPWLRRGGRVDAARFLRETGTRFRNVGWACFAILLVTGSINLWVRGVRFSDFVNPEWLASAFGRTVLVKLAAFAAVLMVSAWHDFSWGRKRWRPSPAILGQSKQRPCGAGPRGWAASTCSSRWSWSRRA